MKIRFAAATAIAIIVLCVIVFTMPPSESYQDPDTFWHIEVGNHILQDGKVPHTAVHTFYGDDKLPYVPHEMGFQIVIASLYKAFGWAGTYLLSAVCLLLLSLGLYRMMLVSRKELGFDSRGREPLLMLMLLPVIWGIYEIYFTTRPQMISAFLIVWFFVFLREFQMKQAVRYMILMPLISLLIANFHSGVWPVIIVFMGMALLESLFTRKLFNRRVGWKWLTVLLTVGGAGLLNVAGAKGVLFILTVTQDNFNLMINEWKAIQFNSMGNLTATLMLLTFVALLPFSIHKRFFRFEFMLGIFFLGVSNYKYHLFMWLFVLYFAAVVIEDVPGLRRFRLRLGSAPLIAGLVLGLAVNTVYNFQHTPQPNSFKYPVKEMDYIMETFKGPGRPKVMTLYGTSGYVMFRGADVLADGRQDPFITDETKTALGWTAFEQTINGFPVYVTDLVKANKPDFIIVTRKNASSRFYSTWVKDYGPAVKTGDFGYVFRTSPEGAGE
ncbi:hypothetical protein SAMN05444162_1827 [Paenibacillaceae bacterium GAS479]|nr:hypothetical protein SAMN05444162_1827 [Paenibacillaceae bacterium GAS479]